MTGYLLNRLKKLEDEVAILSSRTSSFGQINTLPIAAGGQTTLFDQTLKRQLVKITAQDGKYYSAIAVIEKPQDGFLEDTNDPIFTKNIIEINSNILIPGTYVYINPSSTGNGYWYVEHGDNLYGYYGYPNPYDTAVSCCDECNVIEKVITGVCWTGTTVKQQYEYICFPSGEVLYTGCEELTCDELLCGGGYYNPSGTDPPPGCSSPLTDVNQGCTGKRYIKITVSGFANQTCTLCNVYNGTFILDWWEPNPCNGGKPSCEYTNYIYAEPCSPGAWPIAKYVAVVDGAGPTSGWRVDLYKFPSLPPNCGINAAEARWIQTALGVACTGKKFTLDVLSPPVAGVCLAPATITLEIL